jgi:hypothetical protein
MKTCLLKWIVLGMATFAIVFSTTSCKQEKATGGAETEASSAAETSKATAPAEKTPPAQP